MNKQTAVTIRMVGNGFIVEPERPPHLVTTESDTLVFNDLGVAVQQRDDSNVPSLLKFLESHFTQGKGVNDGT